MSKKIFMLLLLMLALISVSAVSAADMDDNADTIVSSADAETIAVSNDVDAIDDLSENVAGGDDKALANDAKSVAAGKNNDDGAYENSTSQLLATSDENNVLENENSGEILKETSSAWYVDANAASGGDGKSEATAFQNLKDALDKSVDNDSIKISSGTYTGDKNIGLTIDKNLFFEKYGDDEAIFDAQKQNRIWTVTATTINIVGLTFKNGEVKDRGGALYFDKALSNSSINAIFINNFATDTNIVNGGGAICFNYGLSDSIINSIFINNSAPSTNGGAIQFNGALNNVSIYGEFINNYAYAWGGAIYFMSSSSVGILNSLIAATFINNSVATGISLRFAGLGGALFNLGMGDVNDFTISSIFIDNKGSYGGAIYFGNVSGASIKNSAFVNNHATEAATAVYWESDHWSLNHNWWGSNNPDWNNLINDGIKPSSYAVLVGSADPTTITQLSESRLNYAFYRNTSNIYRIPIPRPIELSANKGQFDNASGYFENGEFSTKFRSDVPGSHVITATVDNQELKITINVLQKIWYVNSSYTGSQSDGSIEKPFKTLKDAVNKVNDYDIIKIAPGTYTGGDNRGLTFNKIVSFERYGDGEAIFDAQTKNRVLEITAQTGNVTGLTFKNGKVDGNGGAVYFEHSGTVTNCTFNGNQAINNHKGGAVYFGDSGIALNSIFKDNSATDDGGAIFEGGAINCTFTGNSATDHGGAIHHGGGKYTAVNCTFNSNSAGGGGATYGVDVVNCIFTDNKAENGDGGAAYFTSACTVAKSNFTGNKAVSGGAVYFGEFSDVTNCNFINNTADRYGGAVCFAKSGSVTNCNFTANQAIIDDDNSGGAVYFAGSGGTVANCNFNNNRVTASMYITYAHGSAVYFMSGGVVTNCNFTGNNAEAYGAVYSKSGSCNIKNSNFNDNVARYGGAFYGFATITNCNFNNNTARFQGGAVHLKENSVLINCTFTGNKNIENYDAGGAVLADGGISVRNCNFTNNKASGFENDGGAIFFLGGKSGSPSISDCIFIGNSAQQWGGAVVCYDYTLTVTRCIFIGNKAPEGSAIYMGPGTISDSVFLDNRADADVVEIVNNGNNVEITFKGKDTLINAIKTSKSVKLTNVTYWGANGITNTGSSQITPAGSNNEAGQNITVKMVVDGITILDKTLVTDENGQIVLGLVAGNSTITATHEADSYYTRATKTQTFEIQGNETSLDLSYSNFTVEASITPDNVQGNVTFTIEDDQGTVKTVESSLIDDVAKLDLSDWFAGEYKIETLYKGNLNYCPSKSNMTVTVTLRNASVSAEDMELKVGENGTIGYTTVPAGLNVTFVADDSGVVSVSNNGTVTALKNGTARITINVGDDKKYAKNSTVITVTVSLNDASVSVNNSTLDLFVDGNFTIVATTSPASLDVTYVIDNSGIVSVDDFGVVTALKNGTASIIVKVGGDGVYAENSTVVTVTVSKVPTEIEVNSTVGEMPAGAMAHVSAKLNPSDAGNLTYVSNDTSVAMVSSTGVIKANKAGTALITVSFNGTDKYAAAENKTIVLTVNLNDASVSVNNSTLDLFVDDKFDLNASTVPKGLNVTYVIDNSGVVEVSSDGVVTALKNGTASIIVKVGGDGVYAENSTVVTVTVSKVPTVIEVNSTVGEMPAGAMAHVSAKLNPSDAGNLTYVSNDTSVAMVSSTGVIKANKAGTALITVSFNGTDKYAAAENKTIVLTVNLNDASVSVNNSTVDLFVGGNFTIVPTTSPKGLNVTYIQDNSGVVTIDENGTVTALKNGTASIIVKVGGNGVYAENTTIVTVTVFNPIHAEINVANATVALKINENVTAGATLTPAEAGNLTYTSSNSSVAIVENGTIKAVGVGNATITVSFAGDEKYAAAENKTINVTVGLNDVIINVNNSTVELILGDDFTINATTVPEGLDLIYVPDESGVVSVDENGTVTTLKPGIAKVLVKFDGNDVYAANSTVVTVKVKVDKIEIPLEKAFNFTNPEVISVNLPEEATGFVLLDINGTQTHVELVNGKANVTVPKLAEGTYNATVTYTGDDWYAPVSATREINVTSNVPESALSIPLSSKSDAPTTYSISLPGDAGGFLEVEVDGKLYSAPLINGSASVAIPALSAGSHNVTVRYTGDGNYSPVTQKTALNVSSPVYKLSNNNDVSAFYSAQATYKVLVTREGKAVGADEKVTFTYNGKTYTVRTDKNGYATLNLDTNVKVKKYTITATYNGVKVTNKVTIKHVIKAGNKKVKKSKKVTKVKVSLKKVNGKYLKDKVIKIKFKGKTYKLITNKKGVATWKVKKSMLKKLKAGKKYKYQVTYGKDIVTKKLTIKK